jgi:hypothetical protein
MITRAEHGFHLHCDADTAGGFNAITERVSVVVGQAIVREGAEQMWDFLLVLSKLEANGTLATRVLLCHPDWDDPLEIALIESNSETWDVRLGREEPVRSNGQSIT